MSIDITPKIRRRPICQVKESKALEEGLNPVLARILAARPWPKEDAQSILAPSLRHLDSPFLLQDMDKAVLRLSLALERQECIGLETDHDCDGQTSHAVLYESLLHKFKHPPHLLRSYIGHRLKEGYGLSEALCQRILQDEPRPTLIITADNGSGDEPRIAKLKAAGIDVIITDHHEIPVEGVPQSAYACLNPTRKDCDYPDPYVAGCFVAWLLMAATRNHLLKTGYLDPGTPHLTDSLDFVAVGTVADCVSIARSINNRIVIQQGLKLIEQGSRPCWRALKPLLGALKVSAEDLSFKIAPLLNSDGRLSSAMGSVGFLLASTDEAALAQIRSLEIQNQERKQIQKRIVETGVRKAKDLVALGRQGIAIFLEEGHSGVHGIAASRIKDLFGRPTVFLAPKFNQSHLITGSVRGIDCFHVKEALQWVQDQTQILLAFGGHRGAGGLTLERQHLSVFLEHFELYCQKFLAPEHVGPVIWTDGGLSAAEITLAMVELLSTLEPFGREFESPNFEAEAVVQSIKFLGDGTHARVQLLIEARPFSGIWFNCRGKASDAFPVHQGDGVTAVFRLSRSCYNWETRLELQLQLLRKKKIVSTSA